MKIKNNLLLAALITGGLTFNACSSNQQPAENQTTVKSNSDEEDEASEKKEEKKEESNASVDFMSNKGIGPVKSVTLGETIDQAMVAEGEKIYKEKCTACHKPTQRFIGPAQKGVLERRSPEWVMNMILNPEQMVKEDPIAKQLLIDFNLSPMANQNLTEEQARNVLEYFRTL